MFLIIGVLIGAIITTCGFLIYNKSLSNNVTQPEMMKPPSNDNLGEPPAKPDGEEQGEPSAKPDGNSNEEPPTKPEDSNSNNVTN